MKRAICPNLIGLFMLSLLAALLLSGCGAGLEGAGLATEVELLESAVRLVVGETREVAVRANGMFDVQVGLPGLEVEVGRGELWLTAPDELEASHGGSVILRESEPLGVLYVMVVPAGPDRVSSGR